MVSLGGFVKREIILLCLLFVVFSNPIALALKCMVLLFFMVSLVFLRRFDPVGDVGFLLLFLFYFFFEVFYIFGDYYKYGNEYIDIFVGVFFPLMIYNVGRYVGSEYYSSEAVISFFVFFISICFSLVPVVTVLSNVYESGFLAGSRNISVPLWGGGVDYSATVLGGYFTLNVASLGLLAAAFKYKSQRNIIILSFVLCIVSFFCALRLGSRTQIGIGLILLCLSFFYNFNGLSFFRRFIFIVFFLLGLAAFYTYLNMDSDVLSYYRDRMDDDASTFGGRSEKWSASFSYLLGDGLWGWELSKFGYAHNLWLDVARVSGFVPLLFLIVFFGYFIALLLKWSSSKYSKFLKTHMFIILMAVNFVFFVEPIFDGFYYLFLVFCLFVGLLSELVKKNRFI